jgi:hypothetical protein
MISQRRFRILTPEHGFSIDTFVLPPKQPCNIKAGCTAVIHERSGMLVTVHDTRLFPAEAAKVLPVGDEPKSACSKCDSVQGVIEVQLSRPHRGGNLRGILQSNQTPPTIIRPILAPLIDYRKNLVG